MAKLTPPIGGAQSDDLRVRLNAETDKLWAGRSTTLLEDWGVSLGCLLQKTSALDEDTTPKAASKADSKRRTKKTPHKRRQSPGRFVQMLALMLALMFLLWRGQALKLPQHFQVYVATGYSLGIGLPDGRRTAPLSNTLADSLPHRMPYHKRRYHRRPWLGRAKSYRTKPYRIHWIKQDVHCGCTP